jgi:hypothetical protein
MAYFDAKERLAYLQSKIDNIDDTLSDLMEMGNSLGISFDFSLASLDYLELILMKLKPDFSKTENNGLYEDSWIYIGETYRRVLEGKWGIADDEEYYKENFNGLPMIADFDAYGSELFPMIALDVFMDKKEPNLLRQQAEKYKKA